MPSSTSNMFCLLFCRILIPRSSKHSTNSRVNKKKEKLLMYGGFLMMEVIEQLFQCLQIRNVIYGNLAWKLQWFHCCLFKLCSTLQNTPICLQNEMARSGVNFCFPTVVRLNRFNMCCIHVSCCAGLTILLPYLLSIKQQWSGCPLRVFTGGKMSRIDQDKRT